MNKRWRPSVTVAAVIEHEGRFLLVEEHTPEGLRLNNPAGHLEPGETPQAAVVREAREETGREFVPEALLGVYLARFVRPRAARPDRRGRGGRADEAAQPRPPEDVTYLRIAYSGGVAEPVGEPIAERALDPSIVRTLWLTREEIAAEAARLRSPLVVRCIDDHLAGRRLPLEAVFGDASLAEPVQLEPLAPALAEAGGEAAEAAGGERGREATTPSRSARRRARLKMRRMEEQSTGQSLPEAEPLHAAPSGVAAAEGAQTTPDAAADAATETGTGTGTGTGTPDAPVAPGATDARHASPEAHCASAAATPVARNAKTPRSPEPTLADTTAALAERFPALFTPGQARPIKLRIQTDIQERTQGAFTRRQLSVFLHRHTTSTPYLRALVASPQRFDLDGQPAGDVAAEHVEAAKVELERRRQIVMQRRQGQEPRRPREPREPGAAQVPHGVQATQGPHGGQGPRPDRPDRPPRPARADRSSRSGGPARGEGPERGPRPGSAAAGAGERPLRGDRPPRPARAGDGPPRDRSFARVPDRRPDRSGDRSFERSSDRPAERGEPVFALPEDPERRERALLLRSFEGSPLTAANFCALKGLALAEFESQIAAARREREERQRAASSGH